LLFEEVSQFEWLKMTGASTVGFWRDCEGNCTSRQILNCAQRLVVAFIFCSPCPLFPAPIFGSPLNGIWCRSVSWSGRRR
jgi:hypothetical protein